MALEGQVTTPVHSGPVGCAVKIGSGSGLYLEGHVHGQPCKLLVDTGAMVSILSKSLWYNLDPHAKLAPYSGSVRAANGSLLGVWGIWSTVCEFHNLILSCDFLIVDASIQVILGTNFLSRYQAIVDVGKRRCKLMGKDFPLVCTLSTDDVSKVTLAGDITIPARAEVLVNGKIDGLYEGSDVGMFEPNNILSERYDVLVARVIASQAPEQIPLRVTNMSAEPIKLHKGTHVGSYEVGVAVLEEGGNTPCSEDDNKNGWSVDSLAAALKLPEKGLTSDQYTQVKEILCQHLPEFSTGDADLGRTHLTHHHIHTGDNRPVKMNPRKIPVHFEKEVEAQLEQMQRQGVIRPSQSPWAAPVVLVRKKDGGLRFCVDYRRLNDLTVKDAYPLPRIDDTLDALGSAKWFSTLDLASGFWQLEVNPQHREKTAFVTKQGLWEFNVFPYGLTNAPSTFQRLMELVLGGLQWIKCLVYLDDIIIFGRTFLEHISRLGEVLGRLKSAQLKLKPAKCNLFSREVTYLGHVISAEGFSTDPAKVEAVCSWPTPASVHDVRSFLGLASYYRRFVANFASIAQPLHKLTEKKIPFHWTNECQQAFDILKNKLTTAPVLVYPEISKQFILDTDASDRGIGAVLSQMHDGQERVIAYGSRALSKAERNYSTTRKELLAVVYFTRHFRHYLLGCEFLLRTDHSSLQWLHNFKEPEGQVARWLEQLSSFRYSIQHRPGKRHSNADALSRCLGEREVGEVRVSDPEFEWELPTIQRNDLILQQVISAKEEGGSSAPKEWAAWP